MITDREVVKAVRCRAYGEYLPECIDTLCPYHRRRECDEMRLYRDIEKLLKRNEQKKMRTVVYPGGSWIVSCPECYGNIDTGDHYCRHCGQKVTI